MMNALLKGLLWFVPTLIFLVIISLLFFDEDRKINLGEFKDTLIEARGGLFILALVALAIKIENLLFDIQPIGIHATNFFYNLEGVSHVIFLQNLLDNFYLIHSFSLFYVLGLTYFVVFTPVFLLTRGDKDMFVLFSKAFAVNYMFILPGYLFLHVTVTSFYAPDVQPLLYSHPQYYEILRLINRQSNCFPSGHISISLTITLIGVYQLRLKRFAVFSVIFTLLTAFSIIYLGVHWLLDIPAGIAVGMFAYWSTSSGKFDLIFDPLIQFFEKRTQSLV